MWRRSPSSLPRARLARRSSTNIAAAAAFNYCVELVQRRDRERYICNLHAPAAARPALFALHALNCETASIRASTSQEVAGRGRIAWWRHAIQGALDGSPPEHPVATAIAHAHAEHAFTARYLMQLVDAREADLHLRQPKDSAELTRYCERTAGSLLLLGLECAGVRGSDAAELAAARAGTALGMATLLRGTVLHASQNCTYLPAEVTTRHNVRLSSLMRGTPTSELSDAIAEVADEAVAHLLAARGMRPDVPSGARAVLLPATLADHILMQLQRHGYSPFEPSAQAPLVGPSLHMALMFRRFTGAY